MMSMQERIENKLKNKFEPAHLEVVNDSFNHQGHSGDDGSGESHFSVDIVSSKFDGVSKVVCHRMLYDALAVEMKSIHALAISAKAEK